MPGSVTTSVTVLKVTLEPTEVKLPCLYFAVSCIGLPVF